MQAVGFFWVDACLHHMIDIPSLGHRVPLVCVLVCLLPLTVLCTSGQYTHVPRRAWASYTSSCVLLGVLGGLGRVPRGPRVVLGRVCGLHHRADHWEGGAPVPGFSR